MSLQLTSIVFWLVVFFTSLFSGVSHSSSTNLLFAAEIYSPTCKFSLSRSSLDLGTVHVSMLSANTIKNLQPFTLNLTECDGDDFDLEQTLGITVKGEGVFQDNKWLFRQSDSAEGIGILVIQSDSEPSYEMQEVQNSKEIALTVQPGEKLSGKQLNFYAGVSCGGVTGCNSRKSGKVTAVIMFDVAYK